MGQLEGTLLTLAGGNTLHLMINNTFSCDAIVTGWQYKCSAYADPHEVGYSGIWRPLPPNYTSYTLLHKTLLPTVR